MDNKFFAGPYGDNRLDFVEEFIHFEPLVNRSQHYKWLINQHAHGDLFQIFVLEQGRGTVLSQEKRLPFAAPGYIVVPANVAHGFEYQPDTRGTVITLSDFKLEHLTRTHPDVITSLTQAYVGHATAECFADQAVYQLLQDCLREHADNGFGHGLAIQYLIGLVLVHVGRLLRTTSPEQREPGDKSSQRYFRSFANLIRRQYSVTKTVESYAEDLKLSTGHLNRICKQVCGKTSKDVILDYLTEQIKIDLQHTPENISKIAAAFGFKDMGYFSRFFKQRTGLSPNEYRKSPHS